MEVAAEEAEEDETVLEREEDALLDRRKALEVCAAAAAEADAVAVAVVLVAAVLFGPPSSEMVLFPSL